ncbi:MAG TPA: hypothetical protein VFF68_04345, partial [Anaerolineaceae bacterium]|nr:hypothetical protein [Anaerolineaceae bacterium]
VFLQRNLLYRRSNGALIDPRFTALHYPAFWHYDLLFGLSVLGEGGWLGDPRCRAALELLAGKRLPDGGFPAENTWHRTAPGVSNGSPAHWGGVSKRRMNPFVTSEALLALQRAAA